MVPADMSPPPMMRRSSSQISFDYEPLLDELIENEMEFSAPSFFDLLDSVGNIGPRVERIQSRLIERSRSLRDRVVKSRRVEPISGKVNKEFDRVKARFTRQLDRAQQRWESPQASKFREKLAFVLGVGNVFVTGWLMGGHPEWLHLSYTVQVLFWLPWRYYTYRKRGMHYFIADLCYWVNFLTLMFLWAAPWSEHLLVAVYYLSLGSLAWAIVAWRNSLVFHSVDKITSLFIHVFPPAVMHTIVHILPRDRFVLERFPAMERAFDLGYFTSMLTASGFYLIWQVLYYVFIQVRRQEKIRAGRPTSFTWLLKSYSKTWLGKLVLRLPVPLQPFAFMAIQFIYAVVTMAPCGVWIHYGRLSGLFMSAVFSWSIWNGANYYARISAARDSFQTELERLREEVAAMESHSSSSPATPALLPKDAFVSDFDLTKHNTEVNGRSASSASYAAVAGDAASLDQPESPRGQHFADGVAKLEKEVKLDAVPQVIKSTARSNADADSAGVQRRRQ